MMGVTTFHCGLPCTAEDVQQQGESWQQQAQADMHATLMRCFLQLLREQHAQRAQLLQRGLCQVRRLPFSASMPCCRYSPFAGLHMHMHMHTSLLLPCRILQSGTPGT